MNLEQFPESGSAKRMLSYVTKGWYDNSYVGKWLYEVMGQEIDLSGSYLQELPEQFFVETATWGLSYHEKKYGLDVRTDLSDETRRMLIKEKRDSKYPMTPYRMEEILHERFQAEVHVYDVNDPGRFSFSHPNIIVIRLVQSGGEDMVPIGAVKKQVDKMKLSHTVYDFFYEYCAWVQQEVVCQPGLLFFIDLKDVCRSVDTENIFALNLKPQEVKTDMIWEETAGVRQTLDLKPQIGIKAACSRNPLPEAAETDMGAAVNHKISCESGLRIVRNEWYIDGTYLLNGERLLNAEDYIAEL